jgi:hypothetical protein
MSYTPSAPPQNQDFLTDFLQTELAKIQEALGAVNNLRVDKLHSPPQKPRDGDIVLADGTNWDPGSGAGFYGFNAGSYTFLG